MYFVCKLLHGEVQRLLPDKIKFDKYFDKGIEAFYDKRWDVAEKELEKAVNTPYGYIPSGSQSMSEKTNNILVAKYFLGLTRVQTADWPGARRSFEELLETGMRFEAIFDRSVNGGQHYFIISPEMVKAQIVNCHIREGRLTTALEDGLHLLQTISDAPGYWHLIAMVHYNVACVYALQGHNEKALAHLKECAAKEPAFKPYFTKDEDLKNLHDDPGFKNLTRDDLDP
jgi:tetratricopeptide (TPR) repeat protein